MPHRRRLVAAAVTAATTAAVVAFGAGVAVSRSTSPGPHEVAYNIPPRADGSVNPDPLLASGVATGKDVAVYTAAGTGPAALNTLAPAGTPARYIDYALLAQLHPGFAPSEADRTAGVLPAGVTITEAQGLNAMARVRENLASAGLTLRDLTFMRIYVDNPPGAASGDYAGWNRAYRKFVANVDRVTGEVLEAHAPVVVENPTRPARSNIEVATLPVAGWLVEIEVVAAYRHR
jgi:enamine deaminase RidA (YjgF/YER057c/UK114 family)